MKNNYRSAPFTGLTLFTLSLAILGIMFSAMFSAIFSPMAFAESKPSDTLEAASYRMENQLSRCPKSPNCVNSLYKDDEKHYIKAIQLKAQPETENDAVDSVAIIKENRDRLLEILNKEEGVKVTQVSDNYIKTEFSSKIFSFVDDVEFLISNDKTDVKSASRTGYHDMGANRRRIEKIRDMLQSQ